MRTILLWELRLEQFLLLGGLEAVLLAWWLLFLLLQEACALQYYFLILWRILGILPPSKTYMNQLAMNSPEMSECDILHTLRWSSRLRISSYVNWIKVPQWNAEVAAKGYSKPVFSGLLENCKCKGNENFRLCLYWSPEHFFLAVQIGSPYQTGNEGWTCWFSPRTGFHQVQFREVWRWNCRGILRSTGMFVLDS